MITAVVTILILLVLTAVLKAAAPYGRRLLLSWYLREVRHVTVAAAPDEAIVTYPLA